LAHGENGPPHKVAGVSGVGGLSLGAKLRHSLSWEKPAAAVRTLRTNGTTANGAELQKFDRNQNSDVFLIKTAEANVQTHQLADPMGETPSSHRQVFGCFTNKATPLKQSTPKLFCAKNRL